VCAAYAAANKDSHCCAICNAIRNANTNAIRNTNTIRSANKISNGPTSSSHKFYAS
jgi:hypothetical protein